MRQPTREQKQRYAKSPRGRAVAAWIAIKRRLRNEDGKHKTYETVRLKMSREEFLHWAEEQYRIWLGTGQPGTPSVDRIDTFGDYEISNLQMITHEQNSSKNRRNLTLGCSHGLKRCGHCKTVKPLDEFGFRNRSGMGKNAFCKPCNNYLARNVWGRSKEAN